MIQRQFQEFQICDGFNWGEQDAKDGILHISESLLSIKYLVSEVDEENLKLCTADPEVRKGGK